MLGNRAAAYVMMNCITEAIQDCSEALSLDPTLLNILLRKGRCYLKLGKVIESRDCFLKTIEMRVTSMNDPTKEKEIQAAKDEARGYVNICDRIADGLNNLRSTTRAEDVLSLCSNILATCNFCYEVQYMKSQVLIDLKFFNESKIFLETILQDSSASLRSVYAHCNAPSNPPSSNELSWTVTSTSHTRILSVEHNSVAAAILCLGPRLGKNYFTTLENLDEARQLCSDHIDHILIIIKILCEKVGKNVSSEWEWAPVELASITQFAKMKSEGDALFRARRYNESILSYTHAIGVRIVMYIFIFIFDLK